VELQATISDFVHCRLALRSKRCCSSVPGVVWSCGVNGEDFSAKWMVQWIYPGGCQVKHLLKKVKHVQLATPLLMRRNNGFTIASPASARNELDIFRRYLCWCGGRCQWVNFLVVLVYLCLSLAQTAGVSTLIHLKCEESSEVFDMIPQLNPPSYSLLFNQPLSACSKSSILSMDHVQASYWAFCCTCLNCCQWIW